MGSTLVAVSGVVLPIWAYVIIGIVAVGMIVFALVRGDGSKKKGTQKKPVKKPVKKKS